MNDCQDLKSSVNWRSTWEKSRKNEWIASKISIGILENNENYLDDKKSEYQK